MLSGGFPWGQVSASAVLFFAIVLVLTGRLVPRSALKDAEKARDEWREMFKESQGNVTELVSQQKDLMVVGRSSEKMLREIVDASRQPPNQYPPTANGGTSSTASDSVS